MDPQPLVNEQIDAGWEFAMDFSEFVPVDAVFWINPIDSEFWHLYIASSEIEDTNKRAAYAEVLRRAAANPSQWMDVLKVKLLNSADPLAAKVIEIRDRYPLNTGTWYNATSIAGVEIDRAYIYPAMATTGSAP
jgi:hypothetical protein